MRNKNISIIVSILSMAISLITIVLFFFKVSESSVVNSDTFISTCTAFITLSVTMLIGYQIYNSLDAKRAVQEQRLLTNELKVMQQKLEKDIQIQHYEQEEGLDILSAVIMYNKEGRLSAIKTFTQVHGALKYSLKTPRNDYEWIFLLLREYLSEINWQNFTTGLTSVGDKHFCNSPENPYHGIELKEIVKTYTDEIDTDEELIRNDANFCIIQIEYNRVMKLYHNRIREVITNPNKSLTFEEKEQIVNPR